MENQQRNVLTSMKNLPKYDEKVALNPIREHYDKLVKLKLKSYIKQGCPTLDDIKHLQTQSMHQYRTKPLKDQQNSRRGLFAQGEKKLITDYAFYQEIVVKFHFIKQAQDEIDKEIDIFGKADSKLEADLLDNNYELEREENTEVDKLQASTVDTLVRQNDPAEKHYYNTLNTEIEEKRETSKLNGLSMKQKESTREGTVQN